MNILSEAKEPWSPQRKAKIDVIAELLKKPNLKWAVIGGIATSLYGARTMPTFDIDIVGDRSTITFVKKLLGEPQVSFPALMWDRGTTDEINILPDKEPFFKYIIKTARVTPSMRIASRVGTAIGKLAAINSIYRIRGRKQKGSQDVADMLNLIKKMSAGDRKEFVRAAEKNLKAQPYAIADAKAAVDHVQTGREVSISVFILPGKNKKAS